VEMELRRQWALLGEIGIFEARGIGVERREVGSG